MPLNLPGLSRKKAGPEDLNFHSMMDDSSVLSDQSGALPVSESHLHLHHNNNNNKKGSSSVSVFARLKSLAPKGRKKKSTSDTTVVTGFADMEAQEEESDSSSSSSSSESEIYRYGKTKLPDTLRDLGAEDSSEDEDEDEDPLQYMLSSQQSKPNMVSSSATHVGAIHPTNNNDNNKNNKNNLPHRARPALLTAPSGRALADNTGSEPPITGEASSNTILHDALRFMDPEPTQRRRLFNGSASVMPMPSSRPFLVDQAAVGRRADMDRPGLLAAPSRQNLGVDRPGLMAAPSKRNLTANHRPSPLAAPSGRNVGADLSPPTVNQTSTLLPPPSMQNLDATQNIINETATAPTKRQGPNEDAKKCGVEREGLSSSLVEHEVELYPEDDEVDEEEQEKSKEMKREHENKQDIVPDRTRQEVPRPLPSLTPATRQRNKTTFEAPLSIQELTSTQPPRQRPRRRGDGTIRGSNNQKEGHNISVSALTGNNTRVSVPSQERPTRRQLSARSSNPSDENATGNIKSGHHGEIPKSPKSPKSPKITSPKQKSPRKLNGSKSKIDVECIDPVIAVQSPRRYGVSLDVEASPSASPLPSSPTRQRRQQQQSPRPPGHDTPLPVLLTRPRRSQSVDPPLKSPKRPQGGQECGRKSPKPSSPKKDAVPSSPLRAKLEAPPSPGRKKKRTDASSASGFMIAPPMTNKTNVRQQFLRAPSCSNFQIDTPPIQQAPRRIKESIQLLDAHDKNDGGRGPRPARSSSSTAMLGQPDEVNNLCRKIDARSKPLNKKSGTVSVQLAASSRPSREGTVMADGDRNKRRGPSVREENTPLRKPRGDKNNKPRSSLTEISMEQSKIAEENADEGKAPQSVALVQTELMSRRHSLSSPQHEEIKEKSESIKYVAQNESIMGQFLESKKTAGSGRRDAQSVIVGKSPGVDWTKSSDDTVIKESRKNMPVRSNNLRKKSFSKAAVTESNDYNGSTDKASPDGKKRMVRSRDLKGAPGEAEESLEISLMRGSTEPSENADGRHRKEIRQRSRVTLATRRSKEREGITEGDTEDATALVSDRIERRGHAVKTSRVRSNKIHRGTDRKISSRGSPTSVIIPGDVPSTPRRNSLGSALASEKFDRSAVSRSKSEDLKSLSGGEHLPGSDIDLVLSPAGSGFAAQLMLPNADSPKKNIVVQYNDVVSIVSDSWK